MAATTSKWRSHLKMLHWWHDRLSRVQIDKTDALKAIEYWDSPKTFFYIDPPYVMNTRKRGKYKHELTDNYHEKLIDLLLKIKGRVMLSGYNNELYTVLEKEGWKRFDKVTVSHAAGRTRSSKLQGEGSAHSLVQRVESIWINYNTFKESALFSFFY
jgi:DNA adenine methylase